MKAAAKKKPGEKARAETLDLDFVAGVLFDSGLERWLSTNGDKILILCIDNESATKLGALLVVQIINGWIRYDVPHQYSRFLGNSLSHAGLQGLVLVITHYFMSETK